MVFALVKLDEIKTDAEPANLKLVRIGGFIKQRNLLLLYFDTG
jgi:hypothetical protein